MKYLKILIKRGDPKKGEHQMVYPACYDAMEVEQVKIGHILYPDEIGRGAAEEDCVICFGSNLIADEYIAHGEGRILELTEAEVDTFMEMRWEGRNNAEEQVTDPDRLIAIQLKNQLGQKLTNEDTTALNPNKRVPGINRVNKDHNIFFHRFKIDNKDKAKL